MERDFFLKKKFRVKWNELFFFFNIPLSPIETIIELVETLNKNEKMKDMMESSLTCNLVPSVLSVFFSGR